MKRFTSALARVGIGAVTLATVGMGLPLLAASPAAAANGSEQLHIVPVSSTNNAVDNPCQEYRVTVSNAAWEGTFMDSPYPQDPVVYNGDGGQYIGDTLNVILSPSSGINSQFCDFQGSGSNSQGGAYLGAGGNQGVGLPDQATFQVENTDDEYNQAYIEFGVNEQNDVQSPTPIANVAGAIQVHAYSDTSGNNQLGSGEPAASATDTIAAGDPGAPANANQQSDLTDGLAVSPGSRNAASDNNDDYVWYRLTTLAGTSTTQGADVNFQITDSQGDVTNESQGGADGGGPNGDDTNVATCISGTAFEALNDTDDSPHAVAGSGGLNHDPANDSTGHGIVGFTGYNADTESDGAGVLYCPVQAPVDMPASGSHAAQTGPYTIAFFVPQSCAPPNSFGPVDSDTPMCHEPTATATLNTFNTPDNASSVLPTCGGANTARNSPKVCFELPRALTETFTATAIDQQTGRPEANTVINWGLDYIGDCDKYTHGCTEDCFIGGARPAGNLCNTEAARPQARSSARSGAKPSFSEEDNFTGTQGTLTRFFRSSGDSVGVATMPEDCVTKSDGTCSVTLTLNRTPEDGATFAAVSALNDVRGEGPDQAHNNIYSGDTDLNDGDEPYIGGNDCQHASDDNNPTYRCQRSVVEFSRSFTPGDTNIHVTRSRPSQRAGKFITVTGHITNQFGNQITYNDPIAFFVKGGVFSNGTTQQVVESDTTGRAQIAVTKTKHGKAKVTAAIGGGATDFTTLCGVHGGHSVDGNNNSYYAPQARGGNCQAHTTLHFHGKAKRSVERPHLSAGNVHHHHVKLKAKTHPSITHAKVKFYRKTASGLKKLVGADRTNSNGVAKSKVHVHGHHSKFVAKVVGISKLFKSRFSNKVRV